MMFVDLIFPEEGKELVVCNVMMDEMHCCDVLKINEVMLYAMCMRMPRRKNMGFYCDISQSGKTNP